MRKFISSIVLLAAFSLALTTSASAQISGFKVGGGLIYGSGAFENGGDLQNDLGVSINGYYAFTDKIRAGINFGYFFPKDATETQAGTTVSSEAKLWELNFLGNYMLVNKANVAVYGLAGLLITQVDVEGSSTGGGFSFSVSGSESKTGLAAGAGAEIGLGFSTLYAEAKYNLVSDLDQFVLGAGLRFGF